MTELVVLLSLCFCFCFFFFLLFLLFFPSFLRSMSVKLCSLLHSECNKSFLILEGSILKCSSRSEGMQCVFVKCKMIM